MLIAPSCPTTWSGNFVSVRRPTPAPPPGAGVPNKPPLAASQTETAIVSPTLIFRLGGSFSISNCVSKLGAGSDCRTDTTCGSMFTMSNNAPCGCWASSMICDVVGPAVGSDEHPTKPTASTHARKRGVLTIIEKGADRRDHVPSFGYSMQAAQPFPHLLGSYGVQHRRNVNELKRFISPSPEFPRPGHLSGCRDLPATSRR